MARIHGDSRPSASQRRVYRIRFFAAQEGICPWCKALLSGPEDGELDRIVPGAEGGRYNLSNLVLSCATCNRNHGHEVQKGTAAPRTRPSLEES